MLSPSRPPSQAKTQRDSWLQAYEYKVLSFEYVQLVAFNEGTSGQTIKFIPNRKFYTSSRNRSGSLVWRYVTNNSPI